MAPPEKPSKPRRPTTKESRTPKKSAPKWKSKPDDNSSESEQEEAVESRKDAARGYTSENIDPDASRAAPFFINSQDVQKLQVLPLPPLEDWRLKAGDKVVGLSQEYHYTPWVQGRA